MTKEHGPDCICCAEGTAKFMESIETIIKDVGHAVIGTSTDFYGREIYMSYTVGLAERGLPEIVIFSIPPEYAQYMLNSAVQLLEKGELKVGVPVKEIAAMPTYFMEVKPESTIGLLNIASTRAGKLVDALQMVWPDPAGKFMWEPGFDERFISAQPAIFDFNEHKQHLLH